MTGERKRMGPAPTDPYERVMRHVARQPNGCLEWTGYINAAGYAQLPVGSLRDNTRRLVGAHRIVVEHHTGAPIPDGLVVRHKCDNPPCLDIAHLEVGTRAENSNDMVTRGRSNKGARNGRAKLTEERVLEARRQAGAGVSIADLARSAGVSYHSMHRLINGKTWRHVA